jgi:acetyl-CoA C-acetyltransferase
MSDVYVLSAVRTPIGKFGGMFKDVSPVELAAQAMHGALVRADIEGSALDLVIFGNILKHGHGQLLPRHAALKAGIPQEVDAYAVDMLCSSGMMSVINGAMTIRAGEADLVLAGGVESMSQAGFFQSYRARWGYKLLGRDNREQLIDVLMHDGLTDPLSGELMGEETERLVEAHGVTRSELDEVAFLSHQRAAAAATTGAYQDEIIPLTVTGARSVVTVDQDEGIRPQTTLESLAALRPVFGQAGLLTAGNSSQISDGAAALVLASERVVRAQGLRPLARLLGGTWAAVEPWRFAEGPLPAIDKLLTRLDAQVSDFHLFENNEAFALNSILLQRALEITPERINVHGGAIALGHPIGASGARIIVTLLHALRRHGHARGIASLCHGLGGGTAVAVEIEEE